MRLIDADEVLKYFFRPYSNEEVYTNLDIKQLIDNAPTVSDRYDEGYADGYFDGSMGIVEQTGTGGRE